VVVALRLVELPLLPAALVVVAEAAV